MPSHHPSLLPGLNFTSYFFISSIPERCRGTGNRGCSQFITLCLCCSFLLMLFPCCRGSPLGSQALPENMLQHGLLSPQGHRSCQEPAPAWAPHGLTASFGHPLVPVRGPPRAAVEICSTVDLHGLQGHSLPHPGLLHGLRGNLCSGTWSTSSPLLLHWPWCCRVVPLT